MQYINSMYQSTNDYYQQIPQNTIRQMVYAFATGFIVRSIMRSDPQAGLIAGTLCATATAIHGLTTPLFQNFAQQPSLSWSGEMCRTFTAIIATGYISAAAFGDRSILQNLYSLGILYGLLTAFDPERRRLDSADWIVVFPDYSTPATPAVPV